MGSDPCVILGVTTCMCVQMIQSSCFNGLARSRYIIVGKESYFNYVLGAGSYDCFLEELKEGGNAEVEYHVSVSVRCIGVHVHVEALVSTVPLL